MRFLTTLILIFYVSSVHADAFDNQTILVLDASGSMWGQIDGKTKIEIAREVVNNTVSSWDQSQSLGLIAYGHNRKGDCDDIEVLIEPAKVNAAQFSSIANRLNPKGKTPLSAAVQMAAEKMKFTEQKATVILVSDGKETCNLDPCAVGKSLELAGVDFTAHIIGFDVPKEDTIGLRCLAEETGGAYFEAKNAKQLDQALEQAREVVTDNTASERTVASLSVPIEVFAGSSFETKWTGPKNASDYLIIRSQDDQSGYAIAYIGTDTVSSPTAMAAPEKSGTYLVHYKLKDKTSLAQTKLRVLTPAASVDAPNSVIAGAKFDVAWSGPNNEFDSLRIFNTQGKLMQSFAMLQTNKFASPTSLTAPVILGDYEVRYTTLGKKTLAMDMFKVTEAIATVRLQKEASAGAPMEVSWTGPQNQKDRLRVLDDNGEILNIYKFVDKENVPSTVIMNAPEDAGNYTLIYHGSSEKILAQADFKVTPVTAMVNAPKVIARDTEYEVSWYGPNNSKDSIYTYSVEGKDVRRYKFLGKEDSVSPVTLKAPKEPGVYELRYLTKRKKILATHSFTVP